MKAVIKSGGKQYLVEQGQTLDIEKIQGKEGDVVKFVDVLLVYNEKDMHIGAPVVKDAQVSGKITSQFKDKKVIILKFKRRKRYSKKQGHRQQKTKVEITNIALKKSTTKKSVATPAKQTKPSKEKA